MLDCHRQASMGADATAYCQVAITDTFAQRGEVGLRSPLDPQSDL